MRSRNLAEISVRDVAREAGVNHGLVHRYFGSRDALVAEATRQVSEEIHAGTPAQVGLSCYTFRYLRDRPELVRVLALACLEQRAEVLEAAAPRDQRLQDVLGTLERLLAGAPIPGLPDAAVLHALAVSTTLGWLLFRPFLQGGFHLPPDADDQVQRLLEQLDAFAAAAGGGGYIGDGAHPTSPPETP